MAEWADYMDQLRALGERVMDKLPSTDPRIREETRVMLFSALARNLLQVTASDPAQPMFTPELNLGLNFLAPNADTVYTSAVVDDGGSYRVAGRRGGVPILNMTQVTGVGPIKGDLDFDTLALGPNGEFDVVVSPERPAGHTGDWWRMQTGTKALMVRQMSYDWAGEAQPLLTIERIDVPAARPRPTAERLAERMTAGVAGVEWLVAPFLDHVAKLEREGKVNRLEFIDYSQAVGLTGQIYYETVFDLADDECLLLEVRPPRDCLYWSVLLADDIFATIDWINVQSSLNGHQARADADGVYRLVVSKTDPGVPNWLDTWDHDRGAIQGRFTRFDDPDPKLPILTKLGLSELRGHLPADTPVVTPEERDRSLRARREAWQHRRLW